MNDDSDKNDSDKNDRVKNDSVKNDRVNDDGPDLGVALLALGSATLGESGARRAHARLRPAWPGARLAAPAYTVRCTPGDNLAVHVGVTEAPAGTVLVVDVGGVPGRGYWGEVLTTAAEARGILGLVIDGGVRDTAALEAHRFPVFSSAVALPGATKELPGTHGLPVSVGGLTVAAGDWIVADEDGLVIIAAGRRDDVLAAGRARAAKEDGFFAELRAGRTTVELLGLERGLITGPRGPR